MIKTFLFVKKVLLQKLPNGLLYSDLYRCRLYLKGYNPQVSKLYPPIEFPVGRGTPMISPYVRWKHAREMFVPSLTLHLIRQAERGFKRYWVELENPEWAFVADNTVDGKDLFYLLRHRHYVLKDKLVSG